MYLVDPQTATARRRFPAEPRSRPQRPACTAPRSTSGSGLAIQIREIVPGHGPGKHGARSKVLVQTWSSSLNLATHERYAAITQHHGVDR